MTYNDGMIRNVHADDTVALVEMARATAVFKPLEIDTLHELLGDYHAGECDGHRAVSLLTDGTPVGFAYFAPTPMTEGTWHLYWIVVDPRVQSKGLGGKLLRHVEEAIAKAGGRLLLIETSALPSYDRTRQFYLKHGYDQEATVRDFYADGDHQVIFRKRLT